jgi:uncharacterized membrane protein YdcZ (DUF606 family)
VTSLLAAAQQAAQISGTIAAALVIDHVGLLVTLEMASLALVALAVAAAIHQPAMEVSGRSG